MSIVTLNGVISMKEFENFQKNILEKINQIKDEINPKQEWFTAKEAMEYLRIGETKFYSLINKGIVKQYNLAGSKRYNRNELFEVVKNDPLY